MRALICFCVTTIVLTNQPRAHAQAPDGEPIPNPKMVVVATMKDLASGRKEAIRVAGRLGYALAAETLRGSPGKRVYVGSVVTLLRAGDERFAVVSFLGDEPDAQDALKAAKKYYSDARIVPALVPKPDSGESPPGSDQPQDVTDAPYYRLGIVVVGSFTTYASALRAAKDFSRRSRYPYGSRGMIYDKSRGLIWPDKSDDEAWAGRYAPRRYDNECDLKTSGPCVTVERSEAYEGFKPGLYIVVAGVVGKGDDRAQRLAAARRLVPTAYVKETTVYLGCMH